MKNVVRNWGFLLMSDTFQQLAGFFALIVLARGLSPDGYGQFSVAISLATVFAVISNLGMSQVLIREIALAPHLGREIICKILPARLIGLLVSMIALFSYEHLISDSGSAHLVIFVAVMIVNLSLWDLSESVAFGNKVTKYSSILNIAFSTMWLCAVLILPDKLFNITSVLTVYCLLGFLRSSKYISIAIDRFLARRESVMARDRVSGNSMLQMSFPYLWLVGIVTVSSQLPILLLNENSDSSEAGIYAVSNRLMIPIVVAISTASKAVFPFMTEFYQRNRSQFDKVIKDGLAFVITFGTIAAVSLSITSDYWIEFLFGAEYGHAAAVFNLLIWYGVISTIDSLLSLALSSSYRQKVLAILATIDFLILVPLLYYGSFSGAQDLSLMKLGAGIVILAYHWIVFVRVLRITMPARQLVALYSFFIVSMIVCLSSPDTVFWHSLSLAIIVIYAVLPGSPVRQSILAVSHGLAQKGKV